MNINSLFTIKCYQHLLLIIAIIIATTMFFFIKRQREINEMISPLLQQYKRIQISDNCHDDVLTQIVNARALLNTALLLSQFSQSTKNNQFIADQSAELDGELLVWSLKCRVIN